MLLLFVTVVWGTTFTIVKDAVAVMPPFAFLALRFWVATAFMAAFTLRRRRRGDSPVAAGGLIGLALFGGYAFQTTGLMFTTAARAGFITGLSVCIVPLLAAILWRRRPPAASLAGVALATLGLALMALGSGADSRSAAAAGAGLWLGDALVLGCAFSFATHILLVGRYTRGRDAVVLAAWQLGICAFLNTVAATVAGQWPAAYQSVLTPQGLPVIAAIVTTGVLASALAFYIQTAVQQFTTATRTALIFTTEPVFAALFAWAYGGETIGLLPLVGGGAIVCGMLLAELGPLVRNQDLSRKAAPPA